jgi:hypothetical protein
VLAPQVRLPLCYDTPNTDVDGFIQARVLAISKTTSSQSLQSNAEVAVEMSEGGRVKLFRKVDAAPP